MATMWRGSGRRWLPHAFVVLAAAAACSPANAVRSGSDQPGLFPPNTVAVDLAEGAVVSVLQPGGLNVSPDVQETLGPTDLEALGVQLVSPHGSVPDQLPDARVLWVHRSALQAMSAAAVQTLLSRGVAIGILDGSADEFQQAFGVRVDNPSLIHAGTGRPVFVLVQTYRCPGGSSGARIQSDWLTRSAFIAASQAATMVRCDSTPDTVPPDWST